MTVIFYQCKSRFISNLNSTVEIQKKHHFQFYKLFYLKKELSYLETLLNIFVFGYASNPILYAFD